MCCCLSCQCCDLGQNHALSRILVPLKTVKASSEPPTPTLAKFSLCLCLVFLPTRPTPGQVLEVVIVDVTSHPSRLGDASFPPLPPGNAHRSAHLKSSQWRSATGRPSQKSHRQRRATSFPRSPSRPNESDAPPECFQRRMEWSTSAFLPWKSIW